MPNGNGPGPEAWVWDDTLRELENSTTRATFDNCLRGAQLVEVNGDTFTIAAPNELAVEQLEHRLKRQITKRMSAIAGRPVELRFTGPGGENGHSKPEPVIPREIRFVESPLPPEPAGLSVMSALEILTTDWPEPVWAVPGWLPTGVAILAGKQKIGKSWLALQLARAVARGEEFLGSRVERGTFLYLALEDHPRRLRQRMEKQGWPNEQIFELSGFMLRTQFEDQVGDLASGGAQTLARLIRERQYRLVVIDTFSRAIRGDQNDNDLMTMALAPIQEMAHTCNCVVLLIDHHRKLFSADPDLIIDILGATAKTAVADTIWGLYRERGKLGATMSMIGRDVEEQTIHLRIEQESGRWLVDESGGNQIELTERRQEIIDALADLGRAKVGEIAKCIEQNRGNTYGRLQDLVNAGLVLRTMVDRDVFYELPHEGV